MTTYVTAPPTRAEHAADLVLLNAEARRLSHHDPRWIQCHVEIDALLGMVADA